MRVEHADPKVELPKYQTEGSAGIDLRANFPRPGKQEIGAIIPPNHWLAIPTGICIAMPITMEAQIRSRSSLAIKKGVVVLNSPGTIDSDYRGEIKIILINHGIHHFHIQQGDRIAQMVFVNVIQPSMEEVLSLDDTQRGAGGFGSTGKS